MYRFFKRKKERKKEREREREREREITFVKNEERKKTTIV